MQGFKQFLLRGNVIDLAIAVVVGAAFGTVVSAFVKDLLTPLISAIGGKPDFSAFYFTVNNSKFMYGDFVNAIIAFIIVAAVVYWLMGIFGAASQAARKTRRFNKEKPARPNDSLFRSLSRVIWPSTWPLLHS